mmetsp:Transcript_37426/g.42154  ORF Transcript_37426/g.42154 Transcript_37426/m.42154 type:complete len:232 (+) Transcript_37426:46-741(+)
MSFLGEFQKQQKALKEADRRSKKIASALLNKYHGGEHMIEERKQNHILENEKHTLPVNTAGKNSLDGIGGDNCRIGKYRQLIDADFSFGIIYEDSESKPGPAKCASAAALIIPHIISEWTKDTMIVCDSKAPQVIGKITADDWYDGNDDGSMRYVVKGSVPVYLFVENSAEETAESLQKVLKRRVSFRPISAIDVESSSKEKKSQHIIGTKGQQQWMRVRDGRLGGLGITF